MIFGNLTSFSLYFSLSVEGYLCGHSTGKRWENALKIGRKQFLLAIRKLDF